MNTYLQPMPLRDRWSSVTVSFLAIYFALVPAITMAQTVTSSPPETDQKLPRRTPLGTQVAPDKGVPILPEAATPEPVSEILQRAGAANNNQGVVASDMVAEGTLTVYTKSGPLTLGVTLVQNGEHGSQRILLKQPDGKVWDGRGDHLALGGQQALEFLATQHARGLQQFLGSPKREAKIIDNGIRDSSRVVTVLEKSGDSTRYILDPVNSRLARFVFVRGQFRDEAGNVSPFVHSYAFADFRVADNVATPFHIEHSVDGVKQEELQLTKVRYNATAASAPVVQPTGR